MIFSLFSAYFDLFMFDYIDNCCFFVRIAVRGLTDLITPSFLLDIHMYENDSYISNWLFLYIAVR